jgi:hypothetical protein
MLSQEYIQILRLLFELFVAGFSAISGAAALLSLQVTLRKGRFLRAFQSELELNRNRLERQVYAIENKDQQTPYADFPRYHTQVYETIRVNAPTLFLRLQSEILGLEQLYESLHSLDELSEAGVTTNSSEKEILTELSKVNEQLEGAIETVKDLREESFVYRRIGNDGISLRVQVVDLDEAREESLQESGK